MSTKIKINAVATPILSGVRIARILILSFCQKISWTCTKKQNKCNFSANVVNFIDTTCVQLESALITTAQNTPRKIACSQYTCWLNNFIHHFAVLVRVCRCRLQSNRNSANIVNFIDTTCAQLESALIMTA